MKEHEEKEYIVNKLDKFIDDYYSSKEEHRKWIDIIDRIFNGINVLFLMIIINIMIIWFDGCSNKSQGLSAIKQVLIDEKKTSKE